MAAGKARQLAGDDCSKVNSALQLVMQKCHSSDVSKQIVPSRLVLNTETHRRCTVSPTVDYYFLDTPYFSPSTPLVLAPINLLQSAKTDLLIQLKKHPSKMKALTR